jgi:hypothetical protein
MSRAVVPCNGCVGCCKHETIVLEPGDDVERACPSANTGFSPLVPAPIFTGKGQKS